MCHDVRFLDTDEVRAEVASPTYLAGLWDTAGCAMVGWDQLVIGLAVTGCAFTFASGAIYIMDSVRQMSDGEKEQGKS